MTGSDEQFDQESVGEKIASYLASSDHHDKTLGPVGKFNLAMANVDFEAALEVANQEIIRDYFERDIDRQERRSISHQM